ncbi:MAG: hypothetical protein WBA74_19055 [Cyclobacteriaceae bacterium]
MKYLILVMLVLFYSAILQAQETNENKSISLCPTSDGIDQCKKVKEIKTLSIAEIQRVDRLLKKRKDYNETDIENREGLKKSLPFIDSLLSNLEDKIKRGNYQSTLRFCDSILVYNVISEKGAWNNKKPKKVIPEIRRLVIAQNFHPLPIAEVTSKNKKEIQDKNDSTTMREKPGTIPDVQPEKKSLSSKIGQYLDIGIVHLGITLFNTVLLTIIIALFAIPRNRRSIKKDEQTDKSGKLPDIGQNSKIKNANQDSELPHKEEPNITEGQTEENTFSAEEQITSKEEEDKPSAGPVHSNSEIESEPEADAMTKKPNAKPEPAPASKPTHIKYANGFNKDLNGIRNEEIKKKLTNAGLYELRYMQNNRVEVRPAPDEKAVKRILGDQKNNLDVLFKIIDQETVKQPIIHVRKPAIFKKTPSHLAFIEEGEI